MRVTWDKPLMSYAGHITDIIASHLLYEYWPYILILDLEGLRWAERGPAWMICTLAKSEHFLNFLPSFHKLLPQLPEQQPSQQDTGTKFFAEQRYS